MHRILILLLASLPSAISQVTITAKPRVVDLGAPFTLSWTSRGAAAFIEGIGLVPASGSRQITPRNTATYTLVTEGPAGVHYGSVTVQVNGERGDSVFPDPDDFPPGVTDHRRSVAYTDFLNLAFSTLQDALKFRVRGAHLPNQTFYVFFTDRQTQPTLLRPSDKGIRSRRVAYWVRAEEPRATQDVPFEVKAIVEYQRLAEAKWRPETDQQLVTDIATRLKQQLLTAKIGSATK
jgi:hypothetical protein